MYPSVFELFTIGIGPSSSHTVGPMRAAHRFVSLLAERGLMARVDGLRVHLFGSLALTGLGHGTHGAVLLGLMGETPEEVDVTTVQPRMQALRADSRMQLPNGPEIQFVVRDHLVIHMRRALEGHPNGMRFEALRGEEVVLTEEYFSVGGGFVMDSAELQTPPEGLPVKHSFDSAVELLKRCEELSSPISGVMLANEVEHHSEAEVREYLLRVWAAMEACVLQGCTTPGKLPGLGVTRRAPTLYEQLRSRPEFSLRDPLTVMDWVNLYAIAVNEENAAGGRVVTAPTNGAAGVVPSVLHYYTRFVPGANEDGVVRFLLTASAIASLIKRNASISGAEVGCQGEVGTACAMAAAGLTEVLGGTPLQVENAAEIGLEHNLGLTCDPVGGLVQVPCIERNAMASVKAINAARLALRGDGKHFMPLDAAIETMRETGQDMLTKYKETATGGLATRAPIAVSVVEC